MCNGLCQFAKKQDKQTKQKLINIDFDNKLAKDKTNPLSLDNAALSLLKHCKM
jgi:hypothetical protein